MLPGPEVAPGPAAADAHASGAGAFVVVHLPDGWSRRHNAPARRWCIVLSGIAEVRAGADVRRFRAGAVLAEDTGGTHHHGGR